MKTLKKHILFLSVFIISILMIGINSKAATDDDDLTNCSLTVTADITADSGLGSLDVTANDERYSVASFGFVDAKSSWKPGETPKVKVVVEAADGYVFSSRMNSGKVRVKGGTCTGMKRLNSGATLEVNIRLKAVKGEMGEIEDAFWVSNPLGKAKWDSAENASAYEVRLYCGNTSVKTVDKTTTNYYDFYPYMTKKGDYYFKVRPVPRNSNESAYLNTGDWVTSDQLTIDRNNVAPAGLTENGTTAPDSGNGGYASYGWVSEGNRWWYREADGSYPAGEWSFINNKWYLFNKAGYMETGWQLWDGRYYYLSVNGDMMTGWIESNKKWYYLDASNGHMLTGWLNAGSGFYYLNVDGSRASGWTAIGGKWYYFNPETGLMAANTVVGTYIVNNEGVWVQ